MIKKGVPVEWAIISDGRHHDNSVCRQLPHFVHKRVVHEIRPSNAKVENIDTF